MSNVDVADLQRRQVVNDARERLIAACDKPKTTRELVAAFEEFIQESIKEAIVNERERIVVEQNRGRAQGNTGIAGKAPWE